MKEVQRTIAFINNSDMEQAVAEIQRELNRMQEEIWQLRNLPLQPRTVTSAHNEDGVLIWDNTLGYYR